MPSISTANWVPDATQRQIINLHQGSHLVLAPPGCGKTQLLAERIANALDQGVSPSDMICLTFTNRAARGMRERINERVGDAADTLFVGNVHRYCSHFLFENHLVPIDSAIIDDDTTMSILARYLEEDESEVANSHNRKQAYQQIMFFSHFMYDIAHRVPKRLRIHPECVSRQDIAMMRTIATAQNKPFDEELMLDIYNNTDFYLDLIHQPPFTPYQRHEAEESLRKMRFAHAYTAYKRLNNLLDFEDLLQYAYHALSTNPDCKQYAWMQVDEVQDLNPLQLAIIDLLSEKAAKEGSRIFFGDEQQAIFSFMGAKLDTLTMLKKKCEGNVHHLGINHRSPAPLVNMLNLFAISNLKSDPDLLPEAGNNSSDGQCKLCVTSTNTMSEEFNAVVSLANKLLTTYPTEMTAIVVNSNRDADVVSEILVKQKINHFKVSGTDLFALPSVKLLLAHLNVLVDSHNFLAWSRIMQGMKVCETPASSRQFVHQLRKNGLLPTDLMGDGGQTVLQRFIDAYEQRDLIVFDTETTGLNVFEDDVIQIAAERLRQGKVVAKFSVYIETERPIPTMLGVIVNPIIEERKHQPIIKHADALRQFLDFAAGGVLLAHNATFDYHIMDYNIRRYLPDVEWQQTCPECHDSLTLIRLLRPDLKAYKLKTLLTEIGLSGENSHLADDDVNATVSLVNYCYEQAPDVLQRQRQFLSRPTTVERIKRLRHYYAGFYDRGRARLYDRGPVDNGLPAMVDEMKMFYDDLVKNSWIKPIDKIDYIYRFIANDVVDEHRELSLKEQLDAHAYELNTFKEADLCGSSTMVDRLVVSTIHKAKGLEFDNVIVFDVVDGRIPNFYHEGDAAMMAEDARKLYVAMSRAKKRLYVYYSKQGNYASARPRELSRFMKPVIASFEKCNNPSAI